MTAIALHDSSAALAIRPGQEMWTDKQKAGLAVLGIKDCSNAELAVFMHYCQKTQLDPFSRQIYYINRAGKWTIQVGIDGFRVMRDRVAERTGCTAYFEDTIWYDGDGNESRVWLRSEAPAACRVVLVKVTADGSLLKFPAVLRTASYMQTDKAGKPVAMWLTMPEHMIEKCCEAFATRRAFPNDFSGVYLEEEMHGRQPEAEPRAPRVTAAQVLAVQPESPPAEPRTRRPGKTELAEADPDMAPAHESDMDALAHLVATLPLGPEATAASDAEELLGWMTTGHKRGTRGYVRAATVQIEAAIEEAGGDLEKAVTDLWTRYEAAQGLIDG
jgi:phage recombination protein Bet